MFSCVIVDEAVRLGSNRSYFRKRSNGNISLTYAGGKQAQAIARLTAQIDFFYEATGTPCTDSLAKIWGQAWYIDGGSALGRTFSSFEERYFIGQPPRLREGSERQIAEAIKSVTCTILAKDWLDLKEVREVDVEIELLPSIKKVYEDLRDRYVFKLQQQTEGTKRFILAAGNLVEKLLQVCAGFIIPQNEDGETLGYENAIKVHDEKLDACASLVEEIDRPVIIAYYYKVSKAALIKKFEGLIRFVEDSDPTAVEDWNKGKIKILGLHWQAGHGLNLQHGGCDIILYDLRWSGGAYTQLINRIGPARQKAAGYDRIVSVYLLTIKGTVEKRIRKTLTKKLDTERMFLEMVREEFFLGE